MYYEYDQAGSGGTISTSRFGIVHFTCNEYISTSRFTRESTTRTVVETFTAKDGGEHQVVMRRRRERIRPCEALNLGGGFQDYLVTPPAKISRDTRRQIAHQASGHGQNDSHFTPLAHKRSRAASSNRSNSANSSIHQQLQATLVLLIVHCVQSSPPQGPSVTPYMKAWEVSRCQGIVPRQVPKPSIRCGKGGRP